MTKKYELTPEHRAMLPVWREKWIANAMRATPLSLIEKEKVTGAIRGLYHAANLKQPNAVVWSASPISAAIVAGVSAGVWWVRDSAAKAQVMLGKLPTEAELFVAQVNAVNHLCKSAFEYLFYGSFQTEQPVPLELDYDRVQDITQQAAGTAFGHRVATNKDLVRFFVACAQSSLNMRDGGNQWSAWPAYLSFFRHVAKLSIDYSSWEHYETAAIAGPRFMHKRFTVVSELPTKLMINNLNQPHNPSGPFCAWSDGWQLGYWNGIAVPLQWLVEKDKVDRSLALTWKNVEQRRALCEILGWKEVLKDVPHTVIDADKDPEIGVLLEFTLPDAGPQRFLKVLCGTKREFVLCVPPDMKTALQAQAWTWQLKGTDYQSPEVRT